jgi:hypothetical protein
VKNIQYQPLDYAKRSCTRPDEEPIWQTVVGALALIFNIALIYLISLGLSA